jgi:hypothetical protein
VPCEFVFDLFVYDETLCPKTYLSVVRQCFSMSVTIKA